MYFFNFHKKKNLSLLHLTIILTSFCSSCKVMPPVVISFCSYCREVIPLVIILKNHGSSSQERKVDKCCLPTLITTSKLRLN